MNLVVLPTYNESANISGILTAILETDPTLHVLVVDDNSPDGTHQRAKEYARHDDRVHVCIREKKEGLGKAYIAGFDWAINRDYAQIVQMDADFSHPPESLKTMLEILKRADVAVGCRYMSGGKIVGWSRLREAISRGGNWYAQTLLKLPYLDLTGGFNGWRTDVLKAIDYKSVRSSGYAFQVELKYRAHKKGFKIEEFPIVFANRKYGSSKMTGKIVWEAAQRVLKMRNYNCNPS